MIPSTLEVLGKETFAGCSNLTSVVFSGGSRLREIGDGCFANTGLKVFEAPPNLKKICSGAFGFCESLQRVVLNEGLETVGEDDEKSSSGYGVFKSSGIEELVLPSTLVKLGRNTFQKCRSLKKVWIEQRCQIRIKDYLQPEVDAQVFRAGDGNPLDSTKNNK